MNKKIFVGILSLLMMSPTPVFAANPLKQSQSDALQSAQNKYKNEDNSNAAKNQQPFDIQGEAYSIYGKAKSDFEKLQNQYGNLNETDNVGEGFKSYLKNIQEDKDNQALQNEINKVASANYTVKTTSETMNSLAKAVEGVDDEEKSLLMEQQDKEKQENEENTIVKEENDTFSDVFGNESIQLNDKYNQTKEEQDKKSDDNNQSQIKDFGKYYKESDEENQKNQQKVKDDQQSNKNKTDDINNALDSQYVQSSQNADKNVSDAKNTNKSFGKAASGQNVSIQKNYSTLRKQIISAQKAVSGATSKASTNKSYQKMVNSIINKIK